MIDTPTLQTKTRVVEINSTFDDFVKDLSTKPKNISDDLDAGENKTKTFANLDTSCALSISRAIAATAINSIYLYTDNLDPQVYDDPVLCKSLNDFAKRGGKFSVLINNKSKFLSHKPPPALYQLLGNENIDFKFAKKQMSFKNFIVADNIMYRLEIEPDLHRAIASFNDKEFSAALTTAFKILSSL